MYELEFIEHFKKTPVFSLSDVTQIIANKNYAKKFIKKMLEKNKIYKIKRNLYTLYKDPFIVSCFIKKPSYISSLSSLSYHRVITQIPQKIFCMTSKSSKKTRFIEEIEFIKTKYFFGYELKDYSIFKIPIADVEKAIIDSIGIVPLHLIEEAIPEVDIGKMIEYLKKTNKSNIIKRIGYLMECNGFNIHNELKKYINYKYIYLDPIAIKKGVKNKKWKLIINIS